MRTALTIITLLGFVAANSIGNGRADELSAAGKNSPESVAQACTACHGPHGNSINPRVPSLAGQTASYLERQLKAFQSQRRVGVMSAVSMGLSAKQMHDAALYFARQMSEWNPPSVVPVERRASGRGRKIWVDGIVDKGVPACASCHALDGSGLAPEFPRLAGQHAPYLAAQLRAFRSDSRLSNPNRMMREVSAKLSDADIEAVATYVAALH